MEATFDNKTNILNAHILNTHDNSAIYDVVSTYILWGRKATQLKDANPALKESTNQVVGTIHWKEKIIEVNGHRRPVSELKKRVGGFGGIVNKKRLWRWGPTRTEYEVSYRQDLDEWQAITNDPEQPLQGRFSISFRPHLFSKSSPPEMYIEKKALVKDEVFLILVFIYSEVMRQERMNSAGGW